MSTRDIEAQAKALAPVFKQVIAAAVAPLNERIQELEKALADKPDFDSIVKSVVDQIPMPENGKDGTDGLDGESVDPETVKALVEEAVSTIEIPQPQDGQDGADGKDGIDGKDADPEMVRELVNEAIASLELPKPRDGQDGKDALQIEILPEINEGKSYPRGTYAKHNGGLFRSFEQTHGMRGWECIVDGVADMVVDQSDERTFKASVTLASGKVVEKDMSVPALIYKGVFKPGEYKAGDTATWGGSLWVCEEDTSDKPGEPGSKGWRLAVKKGRDGKDGRNGKDLTKGVPMK